MRQRGDIVGLFAFHINHVSQNPGVPPEKRWSTLLVNNSSSDMECGKDLAKGEKVLAIKEIAKVKTNRSIVERMNRCVMTEMDESIRIFRKILQRGNLDLIAVV